MANETGIYKLKDGGWGFRYTISVCGKRKEVIYLKLVDHLMFSNLILLLFVSKLFNDARTSSFLLLDAER
ncbi:hypothetical protein [Oscillibacter sp. ER4]|uniref:hypothetical protein n=1 Tax=Oscillibacter sp. ER4 TaxID=1519439 RepID=UPI00051C1181|nr:hypothetical protein [Oscillibacter sp. ER4]